MKELKKLYDDNFGGEVENKTEVEMDAISRQILAIDTTADTGLRRVPVHLGIFKDDFFFVFYSDGEDVFNLMIEDDELLRGSVLSVRVRDIIENNKENILNAILAEIKEVVIKDEDGDHTKKVVCTENNQGVVTSVTRVHSDFFI